MDKTLKISIIAGVLIVSLSVVYYFVLVLPRQQTAQNSESSVKQEVIVDKEALKKQALARFAKTYINAENRKDWGAVYEFIPQSLKVYVTKEQFTLFQSKSETKVTDTVVINVNVDGDKGIVTTMELSEADKEAIAFVNENPDHQEMPRVKALVEQRFGKNFFEGQGEDSIPQEDQVLQNMNTSEYTYANGVWQLPELIPSEKSLQAASYIYVNSPEKQQKEFRDKLSFGSDSVSLTIRQFALNLEKTPESLAHAEAWIEKNKAERSKPVVNYDTPFTRLPSSTQLESPSSTRRHCSSYTLGNSFLETNCY